jgi:hypothetical protein
MPVQQCEFQLTSLLENLQRDSWPVANDKRALRCTGVAMSVAVGILEVSVPSFSLDESTQGEGLELISCVYHPPDLFPQHGSSNHALRWRTSNRGTWNGRRT